MSYCIEKLLTLRQLAGKAYFKALEPLIILDKTFINFANGFYCLESNRCLEFIGPRELTDVWRVAYSTVAVHVKVLAYTEYDASITPHMKSVGVFPSPFVNRLAETNSFAITLCFYPAA